MFKKGILLMCICLGIAVLSGCDKINSLLGKGTKAQAPEVKGTIIAKVANIPVTLEELNREVDAYNTSIDFSTDLTEEEKKSAKIDSLERKKEYLSKVLLRRMVFYQAALDRGLDRKEEIRDILDKTKTTILSQAMQEEVIKNIDVSVAELEDYYKQIKDKLKQPESRKIREIVTRTEGEARQILIELLQGGDFSVIARERSISQSKQDGGDLGYITRGKRGEQFASFDEVAFSPALQQGAVSSVFKGPNGYYVVRVEGIKEGKQLTLAEVQDILKKNLLSIKSQEELDKFYREASSEKVKVEIYESSIR